MYLGYLRSAQCAADENFTLGICEACSGQLAAICTLVICKECSALLAKICTLVICVARSTQLAKICTLVYPPPKKKVVNCTPSLKRVPDEKLYLGHLRSARLMKNLPWLYVKRAVPS